MSTKIKSFSYFQQVASILKGIKSFDNSNVIWSRFNNTAEFLADLDNDIMEMEQCSFTALEKVNHKFAPTSTYQEISISNGWGHEYINLSNEFDQLYKIIKEENL